MIGDVLFIAAFVVMVLPPLVVFVVLMFLGPGRPPAAPPADVGHMTRSGVPYVLGKTL